MIRRRRAASAEMHTGSPGIGSASLGREDAGMPCNPPRRSLKRLRDSALISRSGREEGGGVRGGQEGGMRTTWRRTRRRLAGE